MKPLFDGMAQSQRSMTAGPRNTAVIRTGRLLEIRAEAGYRTAEDVNRIFEEISRETAKLDASTRSVVIVDWRKCPVMSPDAVTRMAEGIGQVNARTERSATLAASDSPTAVLQFVRLIRDSGHPDRKLFFERPALVEWLAEVLTPVELERLNAFLDE